MNGGLAEVLAAHGESADDIDFYGCDCGWTGIEEDHPAHVAAAVQDWLAERLAGALQVAADMEDTARYWNAASREKRTLDVPGGVIASHAADLRAALAMVTTPPDEDQS